jgi:hypothetical protein
MKLLRILNGLVVRIMARCAKELALLAGLIFFGFSAIALAQSPIDGFDPNANGLVNALAVQSDGKILVGDRPVRGDFDGDGKLDLAVFRSGQWIIRYSSTGQVVFVTFGLSTDTLVPADHDGDGKTDIAVFRNGVWYILHSSSQQIRIQQFGLSSDIPVPADYEGSGKANIAVFRGGVWYILSASGSSMMQINFGLSGDIPVESAYIGLLN